MKTSRLARIAIATVIAHVVVSIVHGQAHTGIAIPLAAWQNAYVWIVIMLMPIAAALSIWRTGRGYLLLCGSMLGALVFGVYFHFVDAGADNVASVAGHAMGEQFRVTALLLAVIEAAGVIVGAMGLRRE